TLLPSGKVLVASGFECSESAGAECVGSPILTSSAELYEEGPCPPDVSDQVEILKFRAHRIPFTPFRFQWVLVRNKTADPIPGPLAFVMNDLQHALFIGSRMRTTCFSEPGDPFAVTHAGS